MIGVTIGIGDYWHLAQRAAESMSARTGLRCIVLAEDHLRRAGLAGRPAAWLKLWLWDFVEDDRVLWFDADTLCLREWNPADFADGQAVVATRDWSWRTGIQAEAESVGVPVDEYFLSSIMLLHRPIHEPLLRLAREILPRTSGRVYEQTALNAARHRLGLPIKWLDRRFNWSLFGLGNLQEDAAPIVAHFNSDDLRRKQCAVGATNCSAISTAGSPGDDVEVAAFGQLGDRFYRYSRIGHDERPILLRADGTIGHGGGAAERFWFVRRTSVGLSLVIGSETERTCELTLEKDGVWRGHWAAYERMPIELMKYRGQVLSDLLGDRERDWSGVELGIFEGNLSEFLLRELPRLRLWMVDRWRSPKPGERYYDDPYIRLVDQERMDQALLRTVRVTEFASDRRIILLADQVRAAQCVPDGSLDFVFVDSDHSEAGTLEAIDAWWHKLRPGGLMAGHDLDYPGFPGVRQAVERASADRGVPWRLESDYVWYMRIPVRGD